MFTFYIQLLDLLHWHSFGLFFVFFICSWGIHAFKIFKSLKYRSVYTQPFTSPVSVIVPVIDESDVVWVDVLTSLSKALDGLESQIIIVGNGQHSEENVTVARRMGFEIVRIKDPGKRQAVEEGVKIVRYPITIILDSDTLASKDSIKKLIKAFADENVGGATPRHIIFNREPTMRRISDWLEDLRFSEVLRGQSVGGAVSCLPGRMFAIRTDLLKAAIPEFVNQKFLGKKCTSGDDRFLTSYILRHGKKAVFVEGSVVATDAPSTLLGFAQQRLRWSRSNLRETILSLVWVFKYPYTAFTVLTNIIMRWFFFVIMIDTVLIWFNIVNNDHYLWHLYPHLNNSRVILIGIVVGYILSGFIRQLRHLRRYPQDILYLPIFLIVTTFVLTPVEWYGNLTLNNGKWMTRRT